MQTDTDLTQIVDKPDVDITADPLSEAVKSINVLVMSIKYRNLRKDVE